MAVSSLSLTLLSTTLSTNKLKEACSSIEVSRPVSLIGNYGTTVYDADQATHQESCKRRLLLLGGGGALITILLPTKLLLAEEVPKDYEAFVDLEDGYSYYYPTNWREFDYRGHDSAFKDRVLSIQNVRVRFIPTDKKDIHDLGPMEQVINDVVRHVYAAPNQKPTIFNMQERTEDGRNYYTFEYELTSPNYSSVSFATIAIGNGRYYTLIVGANERRWKRVRNKLKVVADSFKLLEI